MEQRVLSPHSRVPATLRRVVERAPALADGAVVGRHLSFPRGSERRRLEGGLRTAGRFKARAAAGGLPLVSIITVCLNSARTLQQCFTSVFEQTYDNIEYIVIDGGSTDGTLDIIKRYEGVLDYFLSDGDNGLYEAMNKGLAVASGDYVLFLNSDDWYAPDCVEALVRAKTYGCADFVCALAQYVDDRGKPVRVMRPMPFDAGVKLRMPLRHETMLVSAQMYNRIGGYDPSYRIIADLHLTARLFDAGYTVYEIPRPLLFFRNTGVSNRDMPRLTLERARYVHEQFPFLSVEDAALLGGDLNPELFVSLAAKYAGREDLLESLRAYWEAWKKDPRGSHWHTAMPDCLTRGNSPIRVSVILPVFNAQETLAECIESVLAQSLRDFELICINDASSDGSQRIIDDYCARDPRIVSVVNESNIGHGASRNRGIRLARGAYIFHIDPDDTIPADALSALHACAMRYGSDIVRGGYLREQQVLGRGPKRPQLKRACHVSRMPVASTRLAEMPELLASTEGHWSCLYRREFASRVPYPTDLKMGQDSIFMVRAHVEASSISIIGDVVYHYRANPASAMNTFTFRKFMDSLEWRRRAWHVLKDAGLREIGNRLLLWYWSEAFFSSLAARTSPEELRLFLRTFREILTEAGISPDVCRGSGFSDRLVFLILERRDEDARMLIRALPGRGPEVVGARALPGAHGGESRRRAAERQGGEKHRLRVATLCSLDHGGAGIGSRRRVEALRDHGIDARLYALVVHKPSDYVTRLVPKLPDVDVSQPAKVWEAVRARAIVRARQVSGYRASELFSLTDGVLDFRSLRAKFAGCDVIHLHWVVGMLDYDHLGELADKPVVWTLADMNPFTGGCHYSEGCDEYKRECRRCPLLGGESDLAHETWRIKRRAYAQLTNLHIVCPSQWMAERARESSLLGDREIHYVPNAFPVDAFSLTAKTVARVHLGLPVDKKLLLFGCENVTSPRKGADLLGSALDRLRANARASDIEIVLFGKQTIDLPLPVRHLGHVSDERRLALLYSAADVYLFPSREDNAPLTVSESLLCGTPVVAFPVGTVPALVEHRVTGYVARHLDVEDFADGIHWILSASRADALSRSARCRLHAAAFHDPRTAAERHEAVYRRALDGHA